MHTENWDTHMENQREDHPDLERHSQRNHPKQLSTHNVPTDDVENTNSTNDSTYRSTHLQWELNGTEKSCYDLDWLQKGLRYGPSKLDIVLSQNV